MADPDSIYGLFPGPHSAERGMNALRDAGVAPGKILVMSSEPFEEYSFAQGESRTWMPWLAVLGGLVGGVSGFALAWYTQTAYPQPLITGGMPLVAAGPTGIVTYELTKDKDGSYKGVVRKGFTCSYPAPLLTMDYGSMRQNHCNSESQIEFTNVTPTVLAIKRG